MQKKPLAILSTCCVLTGLLCLFILHNGRQAEFHRDYGNAPSTSHIGDPWFKQEDFEVIAKTPESGSGNGVIADASSGKDVEGAQELRLKEIVRLLGDENRPTWIDFTHVNDSPLDRESVPLLHAMLRDKAYRNRWARIAPMIAWLCDENDEDSLNSILEYIRRADTWNGPSDTNATDHLAAKAGALRYVGLIRTETSTQVLRNAFTKDGAHKLIEAWSGIPHICSYTKSPIPEQIHIDSIRGNAAIGLVLSRKEENVALVHESAEKYIHGSLISGHIERNDAEVMDVSELLYTFLVDAMVQDELIREFGISEMLKIGDHESGMSYMYPYFLKYIGEPLEDGRRHLDSCPICGETHD